MDTATTMSNAIRGDYIKPQVVRTSVSGTGGFPFEVAYADGPLNDFIEGVFRSDWTAAKTTGAFTPTAVDATNKFTAARARSSRMASWWASRSR